MKRIAKLAAWLLAGLAGMVVVVAAILVVGLNTDPGRRLAERIVTKVTSGATEIKGLGGRFPDRLHADHIELRRDNAAWATIDDLTLDWSPLALLRADLHVTKLAAARASLLNLPKSSGSKSTSGAAILPLRVDLDALDLTQFDIEAAVAGSNQSLRLAGAAHIGSLEQAKLDLDVTQIGGQNHYHVDADVAPGAIRAAIDASETAGGLVANLLGLPDIGPLSIAARLSGPRSNEVAQIAIDAGALQIEGRGTVDLPGSTIDLALTAHAPAMTPRPDLHWSAAALDAHITGSFTRPDATGHLVVDDLSAATATIRQITADLQGNAGHVALTAAATGVRLPGAAADLLAAAPVTLRASAQLDDPKRPVTIALSHPLIDAGGTIETASALAGSVTVTLPTLAPLAALAGIAMPGDAHFTIQFAPQESATRITLDGGISLTGNAALPALLGRDATVGAVVSLQPGGNLAVDHVALDGAALHGNVHGTVADQTLALAWELRLSDMALLAPNVAGPVKATGKIEGPLDNFAASATAAGELAAAGLARAPLSVTLSMTGLPQAPSGNINAHGRLAGSPLTLDATLRQQDDGTRRLTIEHATWKSTSAGGNLSMAADAALPTGHVTLRMSRLADLEPLTGMAIAGSIDAALSTERANGKPQLLLRLEGKNAGFAGNSIDRIALNARIADPIARPLVDAQLQLDGIVSGSISGSAKLEANGAPDNLVLRLSTAMQNPKGETHLAVQATANAAQKELRLTGLDGDYGAVKAHLLGPARINFANGVTLDKFRLAVAEAVLAVDGSITPTLAATVSLHNGSRALLQALTGNTHAEGNFALDAKLGGSIAAPTGSARLTGQGLRIAGFGIPPASLDANAALEGDAARVAAHIAAGSLLRLTVNGVVPTAAAGKFDLHVAGNAALKMLDPILTPSGQIARGDVTLDLAASGTIAAPRMTGSVILANALAQDFVSGINVTGISGRLVAEGDSLRIAALTGRAGPGRLTIAGTIGALVPGMPVDLTIHAENARLLASDLLTAELNAAVQLHGDASTRLEASGQIDVLRATINIPDQLPQDVAVLDVRRRHQAPPPPPPPSLIVDLKIAITAPERVFVRGHGIDAEVAGKLQITGTTDAPQIADGFDLRRGSYSIAGQTLDFTSGRISFDGTSPSGKLDPTLNLIAGSTSNGITATLAVTGYADAPKIQLSSTPQLPQDEILARLLFGQSVKQLSPLQVVQIAQALAALGGIKGPDPLGAVRKGLGLDRLSVTSAPDGSSGASVQAGKYVANGIYVGTQQGTSGGTRAQVQIDLTKHLKLETNVGTGGGAAATGTTPDNDPGSSVGLTYQFEY